MSSVDALLAAAALQSQPRHDCDYTLEIVQEPVRARMCGLGDRDRRPITPPLIAKLICIDRTTGQLIPVSEIDTTFLICAVDLRTPELADANLTRNASPFLACQFSPNLSVHTFGPDGTVAQAILPFRSPPSNPIAPSSVARHPSWSTLFGSALPAKPTTPTTDRRSPSSSNSLPTPPPTTEGERAMLMDEHGLRRDPRASIVNVAEEDEEETSAWIEPKKAVTRTLPSPKLSPHLDRISLESRSRSTSNENDPARAGRAYGSGEYDGDGYDEHGRKRRRTSSTISGPASAFGTFGVQPRHLPISLPMPLFSTTASPPVPNLIGALHANAFKLTDDAGQPGIFFVLPDLSVRTEGLFRLRLRLMSIGCGVVNTAGQTPLVASTHSQVFSVTSAKKFEGMMDPTPLSKCFAKQGVRIPTRKVARTRKSAGKGGDAEEDELDGED